MDCAEVADKLVDYHLATLSDAERDAVEAHVVACTPCLKAYLALKRASDQAGALERPSKRARDRLRAEVASTFGAPIAPPRGLWSRRIPLYQGAVAVAIAAAVTVAVPNLLSRFSSAAIGDGSPDVDSARSRAQSLEIY